MKTKIFAAAVILVFAIIAVWYFQSHEKPEKQLKLSGALQALNFWSQQRAYPGNAIPDVGHYAAFVYSKQKLSKGTAPASVEPWQAIGPHNMAGRTLAIAFNPQNPNTIYAGSASGGLWRSYSGGVGASAWEYVPTDFLCLASAP